MVPRTESAPRIQPSHHCESGGPRDSAVPQSQRKIDPLTDQELAVCPICGEALPESGPCAHCEPATESLGSQDEPEGSPALMAEVVDAEWKVDSADTDTPERSDSPATAAQITTGQHLTPIVAGSSGAENTGESTGASTQPAVEAAQDVSEDASLANEVEAEVDDATDAEIVMCEVVEQPPVGTQASNTRSPFAPNYQLDRRSKRDFASDEKRDYLSAKGGSVGAMTLGILAIPGAILTPASAVTALLGIGMGLWGMLSAHRRMALVGIMLCTFALILSVLRGPLGFSDWF